MSRILQAYVRRTKITPETKKIFQNEGQANDETTRPVKK